MLASVGVGLGDQFQDLQQLRSLEGTLVARLQHQGWEKRVCLNGALRLRADRGNGWQACGELGTYNLIAVASLLLFLSALESPLGFCLVRIDVNLGYLNQLHLGQAVPVLLKLDG